MTDDVTILALGKDFVVPLASAVVGALLAYVPAAHLARKSGKEMLERDAQLRREGELTEARRAFVKLTLLANGLGSYREQLEGMSAKAVADGNGQMALWERYSTFAGVDDEPLILFSADELAPFIAAGRPDLVDALLLLQRRYAAVLQSLRSFARMKADLHYEMARLGETTRDEQTLVSKTRVRMPPELANLFRLKIGELDLFAKAMTEQVFEYADHAIEVAALFTAVSTKYFGKSALPALEPCSAGAVVAPAI